MNKAKCGHNAWAQDGHCAEMICPAYVNKCPVHKIAPTKPDAACSLETMP